MYAREVLIETERLRLRPMEIGDLDESARALCPLRPRSTSALVRHRFCALPAPPDRAGYRRAQTTGGAR